MTIICLVGANTSAETAVIGPTQGKRGRDQVSQQNIRKSKGTLETLIPWMTGWVTGENICKELLKPVTPQTYSPPRPSLPPGQSSTPTPKMLFSADVVPNQGKRQKETSLQQHMDSVHKYICSQCTAVFTSAEDLSIHEKKTARRKDPQVRLL